METSQTFNLFFPLVVVLDFVGREKKEKDVKNEENDFFLRQDFHKISECFDKIQYKQALNQTALDIHINDILDQMKKSASSHDGLVIFILGHGDVGHEGEVIFFEDKTSALIQRGILDHFNSLDKDTPQLFVIVSCRWNEANGARAQPLNGRTSPHTPGDKVFLALDSNMVPNVVNRYVLRSSVEHSVTPYSRTEGSFLIQKLMSPAAHRGKTVDQIRMVLGTEPVAGSQEDTDTFPIPSASHNTLRKGLVLFPER